MGSDGGESVSFAIRGWAACAPGLATASDWSAWARTAPALPSGSIAAPAAEMPAMHRRRLGPLGRMAVQSAWQCQQAAVGVPVVFASRYGDAERALNLMKGFALQGDMSPADFTLSVHNAISALYSIVRGDTGAYTCIAAGPASAAAGVIEAAAQLADGAPEVLLVCYDAPLPAEYADFDDRPACAFAWAWRVAAPTPQEKAITLTWTPERAQAAQPEVRLPFGLEAMRFAASGAAVASAHAGGRCWTWSRDA